MSRYDPDVDTLIDNAEERGEERGRREAYLEIIQWLELQPGDDFLYAAKRVRSMAGDLIQSVFDSETGDKQQ